VENNGLKAGVFLGALLQAIGCWIRCGGFAFHGTSKETDYTLVLIGQAVASLSQPFITNVRGLCSEFCSLTLCDTCARRHPLPFLLPGSRTTNVPLPRALLLASTNLVLLWLLFQQHRW
jgi:hypothetical protein